MANQTPFYPKRRLAINDAYNRLERELFSPWSLFNSGNLINITNCEGRKVSLGGGLEFSGTPRELFWRFFDPDLRKVITDHIDQTVRDCEGLPELLEPGLNESRELLRSFIERAYERLADIDQALRGKGFPNSVARQSVKGRIQVMQNMSDEHVNAAIRHGALKRWGNILLEPQQKELLMTFAEAARNVPESKRQEFSVGSDFNLGGHYVSHPGLMKKRLIILGDIDALKNEGFINFSRSEIFDIAPKGFAYYRYLKQQSGAPTEIVEADMRHHVDSAEFRGNHPEAYRKWIEAEKLLWEADPAQHLTTIGHLCREAMQEFAEGLMRKHHVPNNGTGKADTIARIKLVIQAFAEKIGDKEKAFLEALLPYWGTVCDLAQRQEHGAQKEGQPLAWEDARRVVFQTLIVMFEIDRAVFRLSS